jgi:hypothetical protein
MEIGLLHQGNDIFNLKENTMLVSFLSHLIFLKNFADILCTHYRYLTVHRQIGTLAAARQCLSASFCIFMSCVYPNFYLTDYF